MRWVRPPRKVLFHPLLQRSLQLMALGAKSSTNGYRSTTKPSPGSDAASGISRALVLILTVPARLINWLTTPPGNAIMIGLGVLYFGSVSAEGYWQAMNVTNPG